MMKIKEILFVSSLVHTDWLVAFYDIEDCQIPYPVRMWARICRKR